MREGASNRVQAKWGCVTRGASERMLPRRFAAEGAGPDRRSTSTHARVNEPPGAPVQTLGRRWAARGRQPAHSTEFSSLEHLLVSNAYATSAGRV